MYKWFCDIFLRYKLYNEIKPIYKRKGVFMKYIISQGFSIIGFIIIVYSFQCKKNRNFLLMQGIGSFMFFINFILMGGAAIAGAFFNLVNLVRGLLFCKNDKRMWKLVLVECLYTVSFVVPMFLIWGDWFAIFISSLPYVMLMIMSVLMWKGNGKHIRIFQFFLMSPSWIVHNVINFSLGGIVCESFNMLSVLVAFLRYGAKGLENGDN